MVFYIHTDHLDTPRVVLDRSNNLRWRWLSEPFGNTAPEINPSNLGAFTQPLRMPGQVADAETGLFYNYFRDYDASTGRYVQSDPIGLAGGVNTYAYVGGNPVSRVDPTGKIVIADDIVVGGGIAIIGCALTPGCRQAVRDAAKAAGDACSAGAGRLKDWIFSDGGGGGQRPSKTPNTGVPGSTVVNPGSGQERIYGPDGRPVTHIDWDHDHGQGVPHQHDWVDGARGPGVPVKKP